MQEKSCYDQIQMLISQQVKFISSYAIPSKQLISIVPLRGALHVWPALDENYLCALPNKYFAAAEN
jgi:hypothetical protein